MGSEVNARNVFHYLVKIIEKKIKSHISKTHKKRNDANKTSIALHNKEYYKTNKGTFSLLKKVYKQNHREEFRMYGQNRRARIKKLPCTLTAEQWSTAKETFGNRCCYCGEEKPLAQEHFIAVDSSGEYGVSNILPSCQSCNSSKGVKQFSLWYPKFKHYDKKREKKILDYLNYDKNGDQQLALL